MTVATIGGLALDKAALNPHTVQCSEESKARIEAEFPNGYVPSGEVRWRWWSVCPSVRLSVCPDVVTVLSLSCRKGGWREGGRPDCHHTIRLLLED